MNTSSLAPRRCRIVATIGPNSNIHSLLQAGADAFRLNFSHGTHAEHAAHISAIRTAEEETGKFVPIIADMQGPKIRVGTLETGEILLETGHPITLKLQEHSTDNTTIPVPHPEIFEVMSAGDLIKLDDGAMTLEVTQKTAKDCLEATVLNGGTLEPRKGINIPAKRLPLSAITPKDQRDMEFSLQQDVDIIALSFVQTPEDVAEARKIVGDRTLLLSKIEKPSAVDAIEEIAELSDMIMVARGDLGVELPLEQVPAAQRRIVRSCRRAGKPVIIATQMLQSMVAASVPTRAEASDVATAVYMGVDAVMLSAESAVGRHPATAVATMDRIIRAVETDNTHWEQTYDRRRRPLSSPANALCASARDIARLMDSPAIFAFTRSGSTAIAAARERPHCFIYGLTPDAKTARRMALVWGVIPHLSPDKDNSDEMLQWAEIFAQETLEIPSDQHIIILAGTPFGISGSTNMLKIMSLPAKE